ncbi:hypothetical protein AMTRI_Chr02g256180 [Amborella trichopoda]
MMSFPLLPLAFLFLSLLHCLSSGNSVLACKQRLPVHHQKIQGDKHKAVLSNSLCFSRRGRRSLWILGLDGSEAKLGAGRFGRSFGLFSPSKKYLYKSILLILFNFFKFF